MAEMQGATASTNGVSGLVPAPQAGEQNLFLRGDATWANPTAALELIVSDLSDDVIDIGTDLSNLRGTDTGNITIRQIAANEVAKIVAQAPTEFDTLKEIADWISGHEDSLDVAQLENDVAGLKAVVYDTIEVIDPETQEVITPAVDGLVTRVGRLETQMTTANSNISNLQSVTGILVTDVANLKDDVSYLQDDVADLQQDVSDLDNRLKWQDLIQTND